MPIAIKCTDAGEGNISILAMIGEAIRLMQLHPNIVAGITMTANLPRLKTFRGQPAEAEAYRPEEDL